MYKLWCHCGYKKIKSRLQPIRCPKCSTKLNVQALDPKTMLPYIDKSSMFSFLDWMTADKSIVILTNHYHLGDKIVYYSWVRYLAKKYPELTIYTNDFIHCDICPEVTVKLLADEYDNIKMIGDSEFDDIEKLYQYANKIILTIPYHTPLETLGYIVDRHGFPNNGGCIEYHKNNKDNSILFISNFDIFHFLYNYSQGFELYIPNRASENTLPSLIPGKYNFYLHLRQQPWAGYKDMSISAVNLLTNLMMSLYEDKCSIYMFTDIREDDSRLDNLIRREMITFLDVKKHSFFSVVDFCKKCDGAFVPESVFSLISEYCKIPFMGIGFQYRQLSNILKYMVAETNREISDGQVYKYIKGVWHGKGKK